MEMEKKCYDLDNGIQGKLNLNVSFGRPGLEREREVQNTRDLLKSKFKSKDYIFTHMKQNPNPNRKIESS